MKLLRPTRAVPRHVPLKETFCLGNLLGWYFIAGVRLQWLDFESIGTIKLNRIEPTSCNGVDDNNNNLGDVHFNKMRYVQRVKRTN